MPELPQKIYLRASDIRLFLDVNKSTFRKMVWDPERDKARDKSARMFHAIHLRGYAWPLFKRSQVVRALEQVEQI
jgi:hypothetical protein